MFRRVLAPLLALAILASSTMPALAQSSTGEIDLTVVDAKTTEPLGNVRTFLLGAQTANALTTDRYEYLNGEQQQLKPTAAPFWTEPNVPLLPPLPAPVGAGVLPYSAPQPKAQ